MKRILLIILFILLACATFAQTGTGWAPVNYKPNFRDSVNFARQFRISGVPVTPNAAEFNVLRGVLVNVAELNRLVGVDSMIQTQLDKRAFIWNPTFYGTAVKFNTDSLATQLYARQHGGLADTVHLSDRINLKLDAADTAYLSLRVDSVPGKINDTVVARIAAAGELGDYAFLKSEVNTPGNAVDLEYLQSYLGGGGGGGGFEFLSGNVDSTGFPANGDSALTHTHFIGKKVIVIREGQIQQQHANNTTQDGYWFNNTTGTVTFRPILSAGEQLEIWATNTIYYTELTAEGSGGAAESTLLTGLLGGWQLNETSGTVANDILDTSDGYNPGSTVNVAGKFGTAYSFDGVNDYTTMGTTTVLRPAGAFSLSFWVKTSSVTQSGLVGNYLGRTPYTYGYSVIMMADGTLDVTIRFSDDTGLNMTSAGVVNSGAWHNIILTWSGTDSYVYIDNAQADTQADTGTIWYHNLNEFRVGDRGEGDWPLNGVIDDVYLWSKVLTSQERTDLQTKTHPWN